MKVKIILVCLECLMFDVVWIIYFFRNVILNEIIVFGGLLKNVDEWIFVDVFMKIYYSF